MKQPTMAERISDLTASWKFVFYFLGIIVFWMIANTVLLVYLHFKFDPFPFILLNLGLSMTAAIQAPIIMMSGKQSEARTNALLQETHDTVMKSQAELHSLVQELHSHVKGNADV